MSKQNIKSPARAGDWCHGELQWTRPPAFVALEASAGLKKDVLKHSHLVLAPRGSTSSPSAGLRLVGGLMSRSEERRVGKEC